MRSSAKAMRGSFSPIYVLCVRWNFRTLRMYVKRKPFEKLQLYWSPFSTTDFGNSFTMLLTRIILPMTVISTGSNRYKSIVSIGRSLRTRLFYHPRRLSIPHQYQQRVITNHVIARRCHALNYHWVQPMQRPQRWMAVRKQRFLWWAPPKFPLFCPRHDQPLKINDLFPPNDAV